MERRFIIEMGSGNDLYGEDQTKAALRAVEDAIRHASIPMFEALGISHDDMRVAVTIGAPNPGQVDIEAVKAALPRGRVEARAVRGGLRIEHPQTGNVTIVASAAVEAFLPEQTDLES